ncbi:DNA recombination protein RmuC [uncultured Desulfobacter sp.]|uniref:DNA recombination protein RmuC n=1 Tax=uncultured Desulfobacter sp. TaxID=240139 RepID=UPI002AAB8B9B|nr:DNA recombination protein RmuC [uncultured Desulfobacter sp.]
MIDFAHMVINTDNLTFLGVGFTLGLLTALVLVKLVIHFFSGRFRALSDKALYENSRQFMDMAQSHFSSYVREARQDFSVKEDAFTRAVDPVHRMLDRYEQRLGTMEKDRSQAFGAISQYLSDMAKTQHQLAKETDNLVKALRVPHVRGRWGEVTLKRAVELAGMVDHCDFIEQGVQGTGKGALRPDMVVQLPGNRQVVVDAKVPLMAYLDALETVNEQEQKARLDDHARQVMSHIVQLGAKNYAAAFSPSPEFVVLFIPGENFFSAALAARPDLIEKGVAHGVILATPTTLIALLKTVSYVWLQQAGYENARAIRELGLELFERLSTMAGHMNRLGTDIERTAATFNRTLGAMEKRVLASARKFENLGVSSTGLPHCEPVSESVLTLNRMKERSPEDDTD